MDRAANGVAFRILSRVVIVLFSLFFLIPIVWVVFAATKSTNQLVGAYPLSIGDWSGLAQNWQALVGFESGAFGQWLGNSAWYTAVAGLLTLTVTIPAGYALALTQFRFRRALLVTTLVVMLMPNTALVRPVFLEISTVNLVDTPWAVILPFSFFPFGVYLSYIFFGASIPADVLSAARIDGASELAVFWRIAVPLAAPVIALVAFFSVISNWNNYFLPFVMLPSSAGYTLQIGLTSLRGSVSSPTFALATIVSALPVVLIFIFCQRFLIAGSTSGSTTG